ncbi:hypothetical protein [Halalkalicoccus subterraneus]|uniref:hypothetical protein n=1 Tax=Halalkalicoccus subterraneus TaxID=2675002 RepID=UPI000EFBCF99|nr:hypothetical protein [Halalkalicoccus subterraneus]
MSTHLIGGAEHDTEHKLAVLEAVRRENNVRLSALTETLSLDGRTAQGLLEELRGDGLVSCSPLRYDDDLVVSSLPRLRDQERTKLHRLVYN